MIRYVGKIVRRYFYGNEMDKAQFNGRSGDPRRKENMVDGCVDGIMG